MSEAKQSEPPRVPPIPSEQPKKLSGRTQRIVTGAVMVIALLVVLYFNGWVYALVCTLVLALTLHEELTAIKRGGHNPVCWVSYAGLAVSVPLMIFYSFLAIIPLLTFLSFAVLLQVMRRENPDLIDINMSVMPMLTIVLPGMCLFGLLTVEPRRIQALLTALVFSVSIGGDTFAYFVGSALKGPKLCPNISPNKTIAGAVGGLLGSVLCAYLSGLALSLTFPNYQAFPPIWINLIVGVLGGLAGQMGDLFASMVKRHCNIKDFGALFPGHGGMLDRMDSILFTAIIIYCYRLLLSTLGFIQ